MDFANIGVLRRLLYVSSWGTKRLHKWGLRSTNTILLGEAARDVRHNRRLLLLLKTFLIISNLFENLFVLLFNPVVLINHLFVLSIKTFEFIVEHWKLCLQILELSLQNVSIVWIELIGSSGGLHLGRSHVLVALLLVLGDIVVLHLRLVPMLLVVLDVVHVWNVTGYFCTIGMIRMN
jgi:hypothetical protein